MAKEEAKSGRSEGNGEEKTKRRARISDPAPLATSESEEEIVIERKSEPPARTKSGLPVIAIGASAGGFEAFEEFLKEYRAKGPAILFVQHINENRRSTVPELSRRVTGYKVMEGDHGKELQPDTIYILQSGHFQIVDRTIVKLPTEQVKTHLPIDTLFRSLARDAGAQSFGIILSGMGTDGTLGLTAIKDAGGVTFVQDSSARYDSMPASAIASTIIDFILPPKEIAQELERITASPLIQPYLSPRPHQFGTEEELYRIFAMVRSSTGVDFTYYKDTTLKRRIYRRMILRRYNKLEQYIQYLTHNPHEVLALYEDLLINVTNFFRDPDSFVELKARAFPEILKHHDAVVPIRVWVAGCSTGEEAYSIAIALCEFLDEHEAHIPVQIFATDVSEAAIEVARKGTYPIGIAEFVSEERLKKYFKKVDAGYQISKSIRDVCVFARQNMIKDPPFSRLDLVSCRNVMIYFGPMLQKQVIRTFHQALQPNGFLMLGTSETIGLSADLFQLVEKKNKIYARKSAVLRMQPSLAQMTAPLENKPLDQRTLQHDTTPINDLQRDADRAILEMFAPTGVIIDDDLEILHFRGQTGMFLEPAPGAPTLNILKMVREGLRLDLRSTINRAKRSSAPARKEGVQFQYHGKMHEVNLSVTPIRNDSLKSRPYLVLFEQVRPLDPSDDGFLKANTKKSPTELQREIEALKHELADTKEYLQRSVEEQDAYNEELKSANEEIQSSNEELQSTNEELETAKEELQSINEELTTLNDELQIRNTELSQVNNDLSNLLANVNFAVVMVGRDLRIRRFNPLAEQVMNLIPSDAGRLIGDIKPNVNIENFENLIAHVINSLKTNEREVQDKFGKWHMLSVRPYKTSENKTDGAVIIFADIDALKRSLAKEEYSREFAQAMLDVVQSPLVVLSMDYEVEMANTAFYKCFSVRRVDAKDHSFLELQNGLWDTDSVRGFLDDIVRKPSTFAEVVWTSSSDAKDYDLVGRSISGDHPRILISMTDHQA